MDNDPMDNDVMDNDVMDIDNMDVDNESSGSQDSVDIILTTPPNSRLRSTPEVLVIRSCLPPRKEPTSSSPLRAGCLTPTPAPRTAATSRKGELEKERTEAEIPVKRSQVVCNNTASLSGLPIGSRIALPPSSHHGNHGENKPQQNQSEPDKVFALVDDFLSTAAPGQNTQETTRPNHPTYIAIPGPQQFDRVPVEPSYGAVDGSNYGLHDADSIAALDTLRKLAQIDRLPQCGAANLASGPDAVPHTPATPIAQQVGLGIIGLQQSQGRPRLTIAISGPAAAGKTTIAVLLQQILQFQTSTHILHQDDYLLPDERCPPCDWMSPSKHGVEAYSALLRQEQSDYDATLIWDMNVGVDPKDVHNPDMPRRFNYCRPPLGVKVKEIMEGRIHHGEVVLRNVRGSNRHTKASYNWSEFMPCLTRLRAGVHVATDINSRMAVHADAFRSRSKVRSALVRHLHDVLQKNIVNMAVKNRQCGFPGKNVSAATGSLRDVAIVEGSMLYLKPGRGAQGEGGEAIMKQLDLKLFLTTTKSEVRKHYFKGYTETANGVSIVPEEIPTMEPYFEGIIWPQYRATHSWMFNDGDPELLRGLPVSLACMRQGIMAKMPPDGNIGAVLYWAMDMIIGYLISEEQQARVTFVNERRDSAKKAHARGLALQAMAT